MSTERILIWFCIAKIPLCQINIKIYSDNSRWLLFENRVDPRLGRIKFHIKALLALFAEQSFTRPVSPLKLPTPFLHKTLPRPANGEFL
jgi:hypothetical protein